MTTADRFEDRLLHELRAVVASTPAPAAEPARRPLLTRTRLTLGGAVAAAGAAGALVLAGGGGASPAYAVESHGDGSVTVTVSSVRDAAGLQQKLAAAGIRAVVDYVPAGKMCRQPRGENAKGNGHTSAMSMAMSQGADGSVTFTIAPGQLGANETLVIENSVDQAASRMGVGIVEGAVGPCVLVDAPPLPPAPAGDGKATGPSFSTGGSAEHGVVTHAEAG